jgi:hypothetical protein
MESGWLDKFFLESDIPMINHVTLVVDSYYYPDLGEDDIR